MTIGEDFDRFISADAASKGSSTRIQWNAMAALAARIDRIEKHLGLKPIKVKSYQKRICKTCRKRNENCECE